MHNVTSLTARRNAKPQPEPDVAAWIEQAGAEVNRTAANPNEVLLSLLAAGCKITFSQPSEGSFTAAVTMPDGSTVTETGVNPVAALTFAYGAGAWLADLPAVLSRTRSES